MDVMLDRCAGLDIHKKTVTACVRMPDGNGGRAEHVRGFSTFLDGLVELRAWLLQQRVSHVAMEATSNYWLPVVRHEARCVRAVWDDRLGSVAAGP